MTNLQNFTNWEASADILGGTLVTINADGKAVNAVADTKTVLGIAVNNAKAGEIVAVKLACPVAKLVATAGTYTAGKNVFLGANGSVSANGTVPAGWYVGATTVLASAGELDIAVDSFIVTE